MAIKMVRQPSEMPNINNIDDIIGLRYAFGNQDGYVIGKGNELDYQINGSNFIIKSGRVVLQGVESDIDANGITIQVDNIATKQYYTVYYEVNLATNITIIKSLTDTTNYPNVDKGDDLTANTSGTARLELYHFDAQNGVISNVEKLVKSIEYTGTALVGYDIEKGTIEERLTSLGFKETTIYFYRELSSGKMASVGNMRFTRQGNYVVAYNTGQLPFKAYIIDGTNSFYVDSDKNTLPIEFRPKSKVTIAAHGLVYMDYSDKNTYHQIPYEITFNTDGSITATLYSKYLGVSNFSAYFTSYQNIPTQIGYEAAPLN